MIESDCAGCTKSQNAPPLTTQQQYSTLPTNKHQASNNHQSQRDSLPPFTTSLPPTTNNPLPPSVTAAVNLHSRLNYFQHNHFQPLVGPHHLLLAPSAAGSGPLPLSTNTQFALTPDARACVTATYLCVLIVNNTWLDCNLLETLCNQNNNSNNDNSNNNNRGANSSSADKKQQEEYQMSAIAEATMKLNALESALSELIAFAGGGENGTTESPYSSEEYSDSSAPDGVYRPLPIYFRPEEPSASSQMPMEPYVDKGGGGSDGEEDHSEASELEDDSEFHNSRPVNDRTMALIRSSRPPEGDLRYRQLDGQMLASNENDKPGDKMSEQYSKISKQSQQSTRQQVEGQLDTINVLNNTGRNQTELPTGPSLAPSGSLASWVGRPFRGWGSYSFWSSGQAGGGSSQPGRPDEPQALQIEQNQKQQQIQFLRPIDRTEQYNDIITNQSSQKQQIPQLSGQHHHRNRQPENSGIQATNEPETHDAIVMSANNGPNVGGSTGTNVDNNDSNNQPTFGLSPALAVVASVQDPSFGEPQLVSHSDLEASNKPQYPLRSATTPAASLLGVYDYTNPSTMGSFAPPTMVTGHGAIQHHHPQSDRNFQNQYQYQQQQQQQHHNHHHHLMHQSPYQPQEDASEQCKCNELDDPPLSPEECRFRCSSAAFTSTTPSQSSDVTQLATATTFASPTTTLSPGAKMNPLDVTFLMYTRSNRDQAGADSIGLATNETSLLTPDMSTASSRLNGSLPIKIVIHGFGSGGRRPWVTDMVYKLLDYEDVNVIVVDWEKGATLPNYVQAAGNTRLVGHKIASLIKLINAKFGLTGNSYHLIGFSLGAHVAGFAGMEIRNSTNVARHWINRITGLDPASPLFEGYEANDRLDPSDAQFVDVIHSNGDGVLRGGFGSLQPMGHVDFYPNGGRVQVGCNSVLLSALSDIIYGKWQSLCNHRRALNFFMDSFEFNKCRFRSFNCDSYENYLKGECFDCGVNNEKCSYMGYLANYSKGRGKMYLTTHEEAPFCANQFIIKIVGTKGFKTHWGKVEVTLVTLDGKNESFWMSSMNQQSASHELGGGQKQEPSQQQHCMQSLIVAHPVLVNFTHVLLRYTKYKGWIYSGDESWSIDKVFITDSDGQVKSYCGFNTILESHITSRLNLEPGNCTVVEPASTGSSAQQTSRGQSVGGGGGSSGNGPTNGIVASGGVSASPMPQQQSQQQQQSQAQPPLQQQQLQPPSSQSHRTPRLFATMIQQSQSEAQTTPVAMPIGHSYQRISTERSPQPFIINFNNIPFVASYAN